MKQTIYNIVIAVLISAILFQLGEIRNDFIKLQQWQINVEKDLGV